MRKEYERMREDLESLVGQMTLEEECAMLSGESFWYTQSVPRLGIEHIMLTDGTAGLRKQTEKADHLGQNPSVPATCFPSEAALASSWNMDLLREVGAGLGEECRAQDVAVILGPGANIKRSPLCGRNFEYFSEDPYLSSHMSAAYIQGLQSVGVGACVKHFAANNQETHRLTTNVEVDERTLREIYLESFRYAVTEADPWMVMCAYNCLNGTFASESDFLLQKVLRGEWGYNGAVVTDWGGVNDRVKALAAGLDLEMPDSGGVFDRKVKEAVETGALDRKTVDQAVVRILQLLFKYREGRKKDRKSVV
jgi:beta-glucosidase